VAEQVLRVDVVVIGIEKGCVIRIGDELDKLVMENTVTKLGSE
jgi:hypothetical protein